MSDPEYFKRYYSENRERILERERKRAAERTQEERERRREYNRQWNAANRERVKQYRREHAEQRNARRRDRYATDPEYREKHKTEVRNRDKDAKRNGRLLSQFGIDAATYDQLLAKQGGKCAICGAAIGDGSGRRLSVDHCHQTGRVRGILCSSCNLGIGKFQDDPGLLRKAAQYLSRFAST